MSLEVEYPRLGKPVQGATLPGGVVGVPPLTSSFPTEQTARDAQCSGLGGR
jgi:hypothetical protein